MDCQRHSQLSLSSFFSLLFGSCSFILDGCWSSITILFWTQIFRQLWDCEIVTSCKWKASSSIFNRNCGWVGYSIHVDWNSQRYTTEYHPSSHSSHRSSLLLLPPTIATRWSMQWIHTNWISLSLVAPESWCCCSGAVLVGRLYVVDTEYLVAAAGWLWSQYQCDYVRMKAHTQQKTFLAREMK